jgi:predicted RecA/RadA family phage recombinase
MQNFIQKGGTVVGTAPYAVSSGGGALIGRRFGVATDTYALSAVGEFLTEGVIDIAKDTSTFADGANVYWDNTNKVATSLTGSAYVEIGTAALVLIDGTVALGGASGDATVRVLLTPSSHPLIMSVDLDPTVQQAKTVTLTAANIIAMNGAPVSILPAPAAGQLIIVDAILVELKPTSTAFTGGGAVTFVYHGTAVTPHTGTVTAAQVIATTQKEIYLGPNTSAAIDLTTAVALGLDITNATAAFAAGTGVAFVTVWYSVVTLG